MLMFMLITYIIYALFGIFVFTPFYLCKKYTNNNGPFEKYSDDRGRMVAIQKKEAHEIDKKLYIIYSIFWIPVIISYIVLYRLIYNLIIKNIFKIIKISFKYITNKLSFILNKSEKYFILELELKIINEIKCKDCENFKGCKKL